MEKRNHKYLMAVIVLLFLVSGALYFSDSLNPSTSPKLPLKRGEPILTDEENGKTHSIANKAKSTPDSLHQPKDNQDDIQKKQPFFQSQYRDDKSTIEFFDDAKLIGSFNVISGNPFNELGRERYNKGLLHEYHMLNTDYKKFELSQEALLDIAKLENENITPTVLFERHHIDLSNIQNDGVGAISYSAVLKSPGPYDNAFKLAQSTFIIIFNARGEIVRQKEFKGLYFQLKSISHNGDYFIATSTNSLSNPDEVDTPFRVYEVESGKDVTDFLNPRLDPHYGFLDYGYYVSQVIDKTLAPIHEVMFVNISSGEKITEQYNSDIYQAFTYEDGFYLRKRSESKENRIRNFYLDEE